MTEIEVLEAMDKMCAESLSPDNFDNWEAVKAGLRLARPLLGEQPSDEQMATEMKEYSDSMSNRIKHNSINDIKHVIIEIHNAGTKPIDGWTLYVLEMERVIVKNATVINFFSGSTNPKAWKSMTWIATSPTSELAHLKESIKSIRERFNQGPIAWVGGSSEFI